MRILLIMVISLCFASVSFGQLKTKISAADFTGSTLAGEPISLSDFRGKIVVITFWSTTCAICQAELPKLNAVIDKYKGHDVVFLGLTTENGDKVASYLRKKSVGFEVIPNSFGVVMKYADRDREGNLDMGFPAHYLINPAGEIELKTSGWDKTDLLDSKIGALLSNR
jgi:peroxiredoxin